MSRRTRYLGVSSSSATCAGWASISRSNSSTAAAGSALLLMAKATGLEVAKYSFDGDLLQDEVSLFCTDETPQQFSVHPCGDRVLCSFSTGCRLIEVNHGILSFSEESLPAVHNVGSQDKIVFSVDGSRVAFGGKDGHLRVLQWPSLSTLVDEPKAHKTFNDLDISLDGGLLATTSKDGVCRIWDLDKAVVITSLQRDKAERFGFCRFSRNGQHPFLFVTTSKEDGGYIAVWEIANWSRLGSKKFMDCEISALATSCDGKRLAVGSKDGAVAVIEVKKMEKRQHVQNAHASNVKHVEMSPNSRALLSVADDGSVRVTATNVGAAWRDWQVYLLLIGLIVMSAALFYVFFQFSDSFWDFPLGRKPTMGAMHEHLETSALDDSPGGWQQ